LEKVLEEKAQQQKCMEEKTMKKIEENGYTDKIKTISEKGFTILRKNYYFLEKFKGDVEKALQMIESLKEKYWNFTEEECEKKRFVEQINEKVRELEQ
jgi:hypothetical protein